MSLKSKKHSGHDSRTIPSHQKKIGSHIENESIIHWADLTDPEDLLNLMPTRKLIRKKHLALHTRPKQSHLLGGGYSFPPKEGIFTTFDPLKVDCVRSLPRSMLSNY